MRLDRNNHSFSSSSSALRDSDCSTTCPWVSSPSPTQPKWNHSMGHSLLSQPTISPYDTCNRVRPSSVQRPERFPLPTRHSSHGNSVARVHYAHKHFSFNITHIADALSRYSCTRRVLFETIEQQCVCDVCDVEGEVLTCIVDTRQSCRGKSVEWGEDKVPPLRISQTSRLFCAGIQTSIQNLNFRVR